MRRCRRPRGCLGVRKPTPALPSSPHDPWKVDLASCCFGTRCPLLSLAGALGGLAGVREPLQGQGPGPGSFPREVRVFWTSRLALLLERTRGAVRTPGHTPALVGSPARGGGAAFLPASSVQRAGPQRPRVGARPTGTLPAAPCRSGTRLKTGARLRGGGARGTSASCAAGALCRGAPVGAEGLWRRAPRAACVQPEPPSHPLGPAPPGDASASRPLAACELTRGGASVAAPGQGLEGASSSRGPAPDLEGREPGRPGAPVVVTRVAPPHC